MPITLKAARVNANLTQAEASKLIGVNIDTIRNWERGESYPSVPHLKKIERVYEVSYNDLIFLPKDNA